MVRLLAAAGILVATMSSAVYYSETEHTDKGDGKWVKIFDGKSTKGWHTYNKQYAGKAWKAEGGALMMDASVKDKDQRGDLITDKEYKNFDLKLEWKIAEGGNSGVIFYVHEAPEFRDTYNTGPEMQVLDNEKHADAKIIKHRAGDLYDLISSSKETVKPAGEWNKAEVICNKGKLDFFLNGEKVVSTTMWDEGWKAMVAGSKFKDMPGFGTFQKGHIALQDHGDKVWYRNIQIREL